MRTSALLVCSIIITCLPAQDRWKVQRSLIGFVSDAPMERIAAENTRSTGLLDRATRSFAVQVPMVEFTGFNSPLQREHFNENYMVSGVFPNATFVGRIIESVDMETPGTYEVRAKGKLAIHGVERERIIPCKVVVAADGIRVTANFDVALDEHDIRVPRVVQQKIASVIAVKVDALFKPAPATP
jgi:hypothetical protein